MRRFTKHPIVRFLSHIWFGVALLVLILLYASVMSALPQVRGAVEMTEMQAFHHWIFATLIVLFSVAIILATFTRVHWDWQRAGAIIVHAGLLLLTGGALWYFGKKVEGDVLLQSPRIELLSRSGPSTGVFAQFLAEKGQQWSEFMPFFGGEVKLEVLDVTGRPGQPASSARVRVQVASQTAQELDVPADDGAGVPVNPQLALRLRSFPPTDRFYDRELAALYLRNVQSGEMYALDLPQLPVHRERYLDQGYTLRDRFGTAIPSKRTEPAVRIGAYELLTGWIERWRMPIDLPVPGEVPFQVQVTGYVPYIAALVPPARAGIPVTTEMSIEPVVPVIEALDLRRPSLGRDASAIRVQLVGRGEKRDWSLSRWCQFSPYPRMTDGPRGLNATPVAVRLPAPDGTTWEIIYSRHEHDLAAQLAGGKLSVQHYPGRRRVESWRTDAWSWQQAGDAPEPLAVFTNNIHRLGHWYLFQSGASPDGWSWTILGVGNRQGIWPMLLGCLLVIGGCAYSFYLKPILLRRLRAAGSATPEHALPAEKNGKLGRRARTKPRPELVETPS